MRLRRRCGSTLGMEFEYSGLNFMLIFLEQVITMSGMKTVWNKSYHKPGGEDGWIVATLELYQLEFSVWSVRTASESGITIGVSGNGGIRGHLTRGRGHGRASQSETTSDCAPQTQNMRPPEPPPGDHTNSSEHPSRPNPIGIGLTAHTATKP